MNRILDAKATPLTVGLLSHWSSQGGAERFLYDAATCLKAAGVDVVAIFPHQGSMTRKFEAAGVKVCIVPYRWWTGHNINPLKRIGRNLWTMLCVPRLTWIFYRSGCDVIYTNTSTIWIGSVAARILRLPHVWHVHEYGWETFGFVWDLGKRVSMWWMRRSSCVVFNSRTTATKYLEYGGVSGRVIYQGFDSPQADQVVPPVIRIGVVGFVNAQKRQLDVIEAVAVLFTRGLQVDVHLIGHCEPDYQRVVEERATQRGIRERVHLRGFVEPASAIYGSFDVLVVPSLQESFGRVTIEAMLAKKPVVAADSGANLELIRDLETGFLFQGGQPADLAEVLARVLGNRALRERVAEAAYGEAHRRFTREAMQAELVTLFSELARAPSG